MTLPLSRNRTYVASDPANSIDLNAMQDSIIVGAHGSITMVARGSMFAPTGTTALATMSSLGRWNFATGTSRIICNFPFPGGTWISSLLYFFDRAGVGALTFTPYLIGGTNGQQDVEFPTVTINSGSSLSHFVDWTASPVEVTAGWGFALAVNGDTTNQAFYGVEVAYRKLT